MAAHYTNSSQIIKVPHLEMEEIFYDILVKEGLSKDKSKLCAEVFMQSSLEGVYSHGVNRFPRFVEYVQKGFVKVDNEAVRGSQIGALEQWDGQLGPGIINALKCTERAMELARVHGMGCVALSNTNHWMRGGTYGWKAAKKGFLFIGWTNTLANMPAWGAKESKLGNNPLVMALPYLDEAVVMDMAMSQFSYGTVEKAQLNQQTLPVPGGFDREGQATDDPSAILESGRIMPAGYWKGAGLSLLLDLFSTILSGGLSTAEISKKSVEHSLSQVFIAFDLSKLPQFPRLNEIVNSIINDYKASIPIEKEGKIVFPGERVVSSRNRNFREGIPVNLKVWKKILSLL